jgi:hypothetical protein
VQTCDQPALGWTVVLRRQPARIVEGRPEGGYTNAFELICCACGDHPDLDYRDISAELQRIRGPYPIAAGVAAYKKHLELRHRRQPAHQAGRPVPDPSGGNRSRRHLGATRVGCPAFSGQLNWCYFMLRAAGSGTRRGPLAESCSRVPNGDESDCTGARCTAQYPLAPSFS